MNDVTDKEFDALITRAMDELPQTYLKNLDNVVIVMADRPNEEQKVRMKLDNNHLLLGLFEGVPRTASGDRGGLLPSKITLFKEQIAQATDSPEAFYEQTKRTLWHEIAHYYGLSHADMDARMNS